MRLESFVNQQCVLFLFDDAIINNVGRFASDQTYIAQGNAILRGFQRLALSSDQCCFRSILAVIGERGI